MGNADGSPEETPVIVFHDSKEWRDHFEDSKKTNKLMVIDFTASWCRPCQTMKPIFNDLAEKYAEVEFDKFDIDELEDVAGEFGIDAMPAFVFIKSGKELERVVGATPKDKLEKLIEKYRV